MARVLLTASSSPGSTLKLAQRLAPPEYLDQVIGGVFVMWPVESNAYADELAVCETLSGSAEESCINALATGVITASDSLDAGRAQALTLCSQVSDPELRASCDGTVQDAISRY
jgi:hypothetical protein